MMLIGSNLSIFEDPFNSRFGYFTEGKSCGEVKVILNDSSKDIFGFSTEQHGSRMIIQVTTVH